MKKLTLIPIVSAISLGGMLLVGSASANEHAMGTKGLVVTHQMSRRPVPGTVYRPQIQRKASDPTHANEIVLQGPADWGGWNYGLVRKVTGRIDARTYVPQRFTSAVSALAAINGSFKDTKGKPLTGDVELAAMGDGAHRMMLRVKEGKGTLVFVKPYFAKTTRQAQQNKATELQQAKDATRPRFFPKSLWAVHQAKTIADAEQRPTERGLAVLRGRSAVNAKAVLTEINLTELQSMPAKTVSAFLEQAGSRLQAISAQPTKVSAQALDETMRYVE